MKKSYVKPKVYFENFQLSASIASGCGKPLYHEAIACTGNGLIPSGFDIFNGDYNCKRLPDENGYCYQTVTDDIRIFDS